MDFDEYQRRAKLTAVYPREHAIFYPALGLSAEVGELNNKIKKKMRDGRELDLEDIKGELGDVMWYVSQVATDLGISLDEVAEKNLGKLKSRMERGALGGSGDNR